MNPIILFDGECKLCSAWVPFVIKRDPDAVFKFCSVQSPKGQELLKELGLDTDNFETMVLIDDGVAYFRSEAFFKIIRRLKKPWPLLTVLRIFPLAFRDWCYDRIALNRYKLFGKHTYCMLPSKEIMDRFL